MNPKDLQRFWSKVQKLDSCWVWIACKTHGGYGRFKYEEKMHVAHRFAYELYKDKIPQGLTIDHLCRNRACVNPDHLEVVTQKENVLRGNGLAAQNVKKTHCPQGHEYNEENTYITPDNKRDCRECNKERMRLYHLTH